MDEMFLPCTVANSRGTRKQATPMGRGDLPFPSEIASPAFPASHNFAGHCDTNNTNAETFQAYELASPEADMTSGEVQKSVQVLSSLLKSFMTAKESPVEEKSYEMLGQIGRKVTHIPAYGVRAALNQSESLAVAYAVAQPASFRSSERGFVE